LKKSKIGHTLFGSGEIKVIIHSGWMGDSTVFNPMIPFLDTENFTYAFMDYRGYGRSKDIVGNFSVDEIASDTLSLADSLGWEKFNLVGHSMGGMTCTRVAVLATDRVQKLIGLCPVPTSGFPLEGETADLFNGAPESDQNRKIILDFTTGNRNSSGWLDIMVKDSRENTNINAYTEYLKSWTQTNFADEVKGLETETLLCYGEFDLAISKDVLEQTYCALMPNTTLFQMANTGHYPMQETPVQLLTTIEKFLKV